MERSFDGNVGKAHPEGSLYRGSLARDGGYWGPREPAGNGILRRKNNEDFSRRRIEESPSRYRYPTERDWDKELPPEKEPKTLKGQFVRFAEQTSLQGVPFLNRATRWYAKAIWVVILLFSFSYMIQQVYSICATYYAFNTSTSVSIGFETLDFPSVTLCNINPIRHSYREWLADDLQDFLTEIEPRTEFTSDKPPPPDPNRPLQRRKRSEEGGPPQADGTERAPLDGQGPGGDGAPQEGGGRPDTGGDGGGTSASDPTPAPSNADDNHANRIREQLPPRFKLDEEIFGEDDDQSEDDETYGGGEYSTDLKIDALFKSMYMQESRFTRAGVGHQDDTMILQCTFNGRDCSYLNFTPSLSSDYGNCFTFNDVKNVNKSKILKSRRSGTDFGLQFVLFLEEYEYIRGLTQGLGARLSIHPFNTMTTVYANGLSVAPGFQTNIGMRMVNMTRLGSPYNECGDNGTYRNHYGHNYTHDACLETCVDRTVAAMCHCYRHEYTEYYTSQELDRLEPCTNRTQEVKCTLKYISMFEQGRLTCGCAQACNATNYEVDYSVNNWPNAATWYDLTDAICDRDSDAAQHACWHLRENGVDEESRKDLLLKNFMKVVIYYKDLNFETVTEQPAYERTQFLSDFGGTVGLWVGASFITAVEVLDLGLQLIAWCCKRNTYKQRAENSNSVKGKTSSFDQLNKGDTYSAGSASPQSRPDTGWPATHRANKYGVDRRPTNLLRRY